MSKDNKDRSKTGRLVCIICTVVILVAVIVLNVLVGVFSETIDKFVVGYKDSTSAQTGDDGEETDSGPTGQEVAEQIQQEGTVLVKNDNSTLPLSKSITKVNVFGWDCVDWVISGSGSGQVKFVNGTSVDLLGALTAYGISYNTEITDMYSSFQSVREYSDHGGQYNGSTGSLNCYNYQFSRLYEPLISDTNYYTNSLLDNAKSYSDTALVCIGRTSGESNDSPKVQYKRTTKNGEITEDDTRTYLEISTEEEELLKYVGANYANVIVLVNSTNVMELGFMDEIEGLDACLIVSTTGTYGANVIPEILYGDVTPSGRTADTWAYDLSTSSTYANTGSGDEYTNFYSNGSGLYPTNESYGNVGSGAPSYYGVAYEDYQEGIYVGYKWYETADAEGFWDTQYAKDLWGIENGYEDVVQYPFGYGLSYTDFSWSVKSVSPASGSELTENGTITAEVTVKNTGSYAGQDTVELYYSAPYTENGVEKAAVNLGAYAKTGTLEPGEEETVALTMDVRDMASYDCYNLSGAVGSDGGYVLEKGDYTLTLRTDAHTVAADRFAEEDTDSATITLTASDDIVYNTDDATGSQVSNVFTGTTATDGVAIDGNSDGTANITYLTRSDFTDTFPAKMTAAREITDAVKKYNTYSQALATEWDTSHATSESVTFGDSTQGGDIASKDGKTYTLTDLGNIIAQNYDAEEWEGVLNRITSKEMQDLVLHGYTKTAAISSIGKPKTADYDGPNQIGSFVSSYNKATGFSAIVLAQTWNTDLATEMGLIVGEECATNGINGWYGPACNIHRSPFGGRNYEYYSEDALLSGQMCANTVAAAKNKGVFCYLKHMCLYESESGRDGMYTWLTEQALREIYIRPFEIAVKEGGATGIMSSYGRIGAVWTGGSEGLLTDVLRNEWGFSGAVITDYADHQEYMNGDQMIRAGGNLWMDGWLSNGSFQYDTTSNAFNIALRNATKGVVYMWANALWTNADYNAKVASGEISGTITQVTESELNFRWYIPVLVVVDVLVIAGCAIWIWRRFFRKPKA
ncbi:MAG: glycoside hydrolase family 3 C-terminal domain-containing protein [Clostridia bacterium]|nr:glycoside hydrolase family 3 C-terminal domain-containing protein [Clostridia bacterium]